MRNDLFNPALFWEFLSDLNHFSSLFMPLFLIVTSLAWALREKTTVSYIALLGSIFVIASRVTHELVASVDSIHARHLEPALGQDPVIWVLYLHAFNIGHIIFIACIAYRFIFQGNPSK